MHLFNGWWKELLDHAHVSIFLSSAAARARAVFSAPEVIKMALVALVTTSATSVVTVAVLSERIEGNQKTIRAELDSVKTELRGVQASVTREREILVANRTREVERIDRRLDRIDTMLIEMQRPQRR